MDERRKEALTKHHQALRAGLLVGNILPALRPLLTGVEYSRVRDREDNVSRVDELIEILLTKDNRHFDTFCAALERNGYEHWARTLREEVPRVDGSILDAPLAQGEVYYPIIDELADEFSLIVAKIAQEVYSLSRSRLVGLKMCVEEKLKSKSTPSTLPSSAEDLISAMSKYWGFLSFELTELVVDYLHIEELLIQFKKYKESLQEGTSRLITHCQNEHITPREPPRCKSMELTVDVDPHSYSLHRILEAKEFLVVHMKMKVALFVGLRPGSIILHFYILEDDAETAVHQLKEHELQLRNLQVVAIEIDGVIVYQDTPSKMHSSVAVMSNNINCLADALKIEGPIFPNLLKFGSAVVTVGEKVQAVLQEVMNKDIKSILQVKDALHNLKLLVEVACAFLNEVDDMFHCCQSNLMTAVIQGLSCSPPNPQPLCDLISQLGNSLAQADTKYCKLVGACNAASCSCSEAEEVCARMERESQIEKRATRGIGRAAAVGAVVGGGIAASALIGSVTFGIGTAVGMGITAAVAGAVAGGEAGVVQQHTASDYEKSEAAFRRIRGEFEALLHFAYDLEEGVAQVHTTLENIATQVDSICYSADMVKNIALIKDSVKHLNMVCTASYGKTSRSREDVRGKTEELKAKFKCV